MLVRRIARAALAGYFVNEGVKAFTNTESQAAAAAPFVEFISRESGKKVPNDPKLVVRAQGGVMVGAGLALGLGKLPRISSALLAPTALANAYMHEAFWAEKDETVRAKKQSDFFRALAVVGGVLLATADTAGKPGLAWRASHGAAVTKRETTRAAKLAAATARREAKLLAAQAGSALPS